MIDKLTFLRQRVLLPIGVVAVVLGAVGDVLVRSTVLFAVGLVVTSAAVAGMAVVLHLDRPELREVNEVSHFSTTGETP